MATMPNCIGLAYEDALTAMVTAGVRVLPLGYFQPDPVIISFIQPINGQSGIVISQDPPSGSLNVGANSVIQLTVASYPIGIAENGGIDYWPRLDFDFILDQTKLS